MIHAAARELLEWAPLMRRVRLVVLILVLLASTSSAGWPAASHQAYVELPRIAATLKARLETAPNGAQARLITRGRVITFTRNRARVAVNGSPDTNDKLVSVTSDVGTVSISGDSTVPANGVLVVGEPDGQTKPLEAAEKAEAVQAKVALSKPITNGLTYQFTFTFEKAGKTSAQVPISAGEQPRREAAAEAG